MSAEISGQLISRGVGKNSGEKTVILSVEKEHLLKLLWLKTVVSNKAQASCLFGTSVGMQRPKR